MNKKIIIIGGGIAGLSAGIHAQKNGLKSVIYEQHYLLGGLCTAWNRQGFNIDGCIHWLTGVNKESYLYKNWQALHAFKDSEVFLNDNFGTFEHEGVTLTLWSDLNRLRYEWIQISPEDQNAILRFASIVEIISNLPLTVSEPIGLKPFHILLRDGLKLFPYLIPYFSLAKMTCEQLAEQFKHPAIKWVMTHAQPGAGNAFSFLFSYGSHVKNDAGLLKGGSMTLVRNMEKYYRELGGEVVLSTRVEEIVIEDKKTRGILLKDGALIEADYVVSTCDASVTFKQLLKKKYEIPKFSKLKTKQETYPTVACCQLSFALDQELSATLKNPTVMKIRPIQVASQTIDHLNFKTYDFDRATFQKGNEITITTLLDQTDEDYYFWRTLKRESYTVYRKHKEKLTEELLERIYEVRPEFKGKIKFLDFATPITYHRYTSAYHGAYMPFRYTARGSMFTHSGKIQDVDGLFVAGQWVQTPGGLPLAMVSGQYAIQRICKELNIRFHLDGPIRKGKALKYITLIKD